jgi:hypothetical protein
MLMEKQRGCAPRSALPSQSATQMLLSNPRAAPAKVALHPLNIQAQRLPACAIYALQQPPNSVAHTSGPNGSEFCKLSLRGIAMLSV